MEMTCTKSKNEIDSSSSFYYFKPREKWTIFKHFIKLRKHRTSFLSHLHKVEKSWIPLEIILIEIIKIQFKVIMCSFNSFSGYLNIDAIIESHLAYGQYNNKYENALVACVGLDFIGHWFDLDAKNELLIIKRTRDVMVVFFLEIDCLIARNNFCIFIREMASE